MFLKRRKSTKILERESITMHDTVRNSFINFISPFEGRVHYMYLDTKGLVTIGLGNLIDSSEHSLQDPPASALSLPLFFKDAPGQQATQGDIAQEWRGVKAFKQQATVTPQNPQGLSHTFFEGRTRLRMSDSTIDALAVRKLAEFEQALKTGTAEFANFDAWPADAQLGLLAMAWAMGPAFAQGGKWPMFRAACQAQNWDAAAAQCKISNALPARNRAHFVLFTNAARVADGTAPSPDITLLYYPTVLTAGVDPVNPTPSPASRPMHEGWPLLKEGSTDVLVGTLQLLLREQGFPLTVDGVFSPAVTAAVRDVQAQNNLSVDGHVGRGTWDALIVLRELGDAGDAVSAIQDRLSFWDLDLSFPEDGAFDTTTDLAVRVFQGASSLAVDGRVGGNTWQALLNF
jgi:GH24 family phage-related lysozyme (muramidase)